MKRPSWKRYQERLRRSRVKKRFWESATQRIVRLSLVLAAVALVGVGVAALWPDPLQSNAPDPFTGGIAAGKPLAKKDLQVLLEGGWLTNLMDRRFDVRIGESVYRIETSLDTDLQRFLIDALETSIGRYVGIVMLDPLSGRIIAMANHAKTDPVPNLCTQKTFPAASIFKIITAAAAIEACGFDSNTQINYNGRKYTLYKSQLKKRINKYTHKVTFEDSFAQSVNPVFGKIGIHYLGKPVLEEYAESFGFNREIAFEIPVSQSRLQMDDDTYHLAEVACGFNRQTLISPLHGALIASAVVNQGKLLEPSLIDSIRDRENGIVYQRQARPMAAPINPDTALVLQKLMGATIDSGTSRKAFRGYRKDRVLSKLMIGGKTGSIDNRAHDARIDWFVGFARKKEGAGQIALAVIVAHEKYIGTRASAYARMAIKAYFSNKHETQSRPTRHVTG